MTEFNVKHMFICDFCRNECKACNDDMDRLRSGIIDDKNKDLVNRKAEIKCLGQYCPKPCKYQDLECFKDVDIRPLLKLIEFLGKKCNELIQENVIKTE